MNTYHKLQALVRNKQYLKDLKGLSHNKQEEFCKKYGLSIPITPEEARKYKDKPEIFKLYIAEDEFVVRAIKSDKDMSCWKKVSSKYKRGIEHLEFKFDKSAWLKNGRFLTIEIDLTKKKKDIMEGLKRNVDLFSKPVVKEAGRNKESLFDPWEVYDLYHKDKLNFTKIAKKLSGEKGNPTYNPKLEKYHRRVKRSYDIARIMMQKVQKEIKGENPINE